MSLILYLKPQKIRAVRLILANSKIIKLWFKIAVRDLKNSKALIDLGATHKHAAAYHAQQCAEKAIKGFLTSKSDNSKFMKAFL